MAALSFVSEAKLRTPRDVEDLQGDEGCEKNRRKQCNPVYCEVWTSGPRAPARPHPGTGTVKSQDSISCSICSLRVIDRIKLITSVGLHLINTAVINYD